MRSVWILTAISSVACASGGSSPGTLQSPSERIVARDNAAVIRTAVAPNAKVNIPAEPARVFESLKAVFEELGIPVATVDAAMSQVGNSNFARTRKLGNERISLYLSCGNSVTGVIADDYRIYMSVMSQARADGKGGTELETAFTAFARNIDGSAAERIACGTTGQLEEKIRLAVLRKLESK
jgi:hypothetical protein